MLQALYSDGDDAIVQHWQRQATPDSFTQAVQFVWNHAGALLVVALVAFLFFWLQSYSEIPVAAMPRQEPEEVNDGTEENDSDDDFLMQTMLQTTIMNMQTTVNH